MCWCIDVGLCFMFQILKHIVNNFFGYKLEWICFIPKFLKQFYATPQREKKNKNKTKSREIFFCIFFFYFNLLQQQQQEEQLPIDI